MAYIITEPCIGTKDSACVDVCPVDCIILHPDIVETKEQLYGKYLVLTGQQQVPQG